MKTNQYQEKIKCDFYLNEFYSEDLKTFTHPALSEHPVPVDRWHTVFQEMNIWEVRFHSYELNGGAKTWCSFKTGSKKSPYSVEIDDLTSLLKGNSLFYVRGDNKKIEKKEFLDFLLTIHQIQNFPEQDTEGASFLFSQYLKKLLIKEIVPFFKEKVVPLSFVKNPEVSMEKGLKIVVKFPFEEDLVLFHYKTPLKRSIRWADKENESPVTICQKLYRAVENDLERINFKIKESEAVIIVYWILYDLVLEQFKKTKQFKLRNSFLNAMI